MARKRKTGDTSYNARRREYRAAQRYLKKAETSSGATAEKNRAIAYMHLQNAIATYDPTQSQRISTPIANMAAQFGMTVTDIRQRYQSISQKQRTRAIKESGEALASVPDELKRENEAKALLENPSISKRVFGGLVDIWRDKVKSGVSAADNRQAIEKALFDYFNVSSYHEILDILENNIGQGLFDVSSDYEIYDYVKIALQKHVIANTLISQ